MNLAETNTHRYEDQFFQFDQMHYEVQYHLSKIDHSITENAEPDYGDDLVNEGLTNKDLGDEEFDDRNSNEDADE